MQASDCNDYLSIWCTGSNMLTFFQDNREVMDFGCVLHLRRSPQFNYDFFRSITMHTMCFKRNRNLIANKSHKSFHKSSVTISSQTRWHCMRLAQYSHCFVSSAVTRGKRCRVGERTKKKKNTPKNSNTDKHTSSKPSGWKENKHTESLRKRACNPFSKARFVPTPIEATQRLFAPELLTLSSPPIQTAHQLFFNPTDKPIMRAIMASKTTTITTIITIFCWEQPIGYSTIRTEQDWNYMLSLCIRSTIMKSTTVCYIIFVQVLYSKYCIIYHESLCSCVTV